MHILHVSAEMAPIAKVGGLGDVVYGLSVAQRELGHDVSVILPRYDVLQSAYISQIGIEVKHLEWDFWGTNYHQTIWRGTVCDLPVFLVDPMHPSEYFDRGRIYGCADDIIRFMYYSRTVVEYLKSLPRLPDVIHVHDWQSAACIPLLADLNLKGCKLIFTIHNMEYQGKCSIDEAKSIGIKDIDAMRDNIYPECVNLLKGAILAADQVTTVSPTYAEETKSVDFGKGLETTLLQVKHKFHGVLNGIDSKYWNPEYDDYLPRHFSEKSALKGKQMAKDLIRKRLYLDVVDKPLVANIGRLVPQKGVDLIKGALFHTLENGGQFILQGTSPIDEIKREFYHLKERFAEHPDVHIELHTEEELTHMIYAASDIFIVPSLFEPCGLTQLIALKYGSIPIVRKTGGLADTVVDVSFGNAGNGFVFQEPTMSALNHTIDRAFHLWHNDRKRWSELVLKGVSSDFGWKASAEKYLSLYLS